MMGSLLNKKAMKQFILEKCQSLRPGWECERVSQKAIESIDFFLKRKIVDSVTRHPTKGKTFLYFE